MALDASTVIVPARGHYWIAPAGTARPADPAAPTTPWAEVGHTSRDEPMTVTREGGERTVLSSWQVDNLRERVDPVTYSVGFTVLQHDQTALALYYGGGTFSATTGEFVIPETATPQEHALFIQLIDEAAGLERYRYFPKVSILGSDNETADVENLLGLPVSATILSDDGDSLDGLFAIQIAEPTP